MASKKICPSCGAQNPSDAYSCSNCGTSFVDSSSVSFPTSTSPSSASGSSPSPYSTPVPPPPRSSWSYPSPQQQDQDTGMGAQAQEEEEGRGAGAPPSGMTSTAGGQPVAVVKQSALGSIVNSLSSVVILLLFGIGIAGGGIGSYYLIWLGVAALIIVVPALLSYLYRPTFEFYDTYLVRSSRRGSEQIEYSEMQSVAQSRSRISISLKSNQGQRFGYRRLLVPGNPKLAEGTTLGTWLEKRVPRPPNPAEASSQGSANL